MKGVIDGKPVDGERVDLYLIAETLAQADSVAAVYVSDSEEQRMSGQSCTTIATRR